MKKSRDREICCVQCGDSFLFREGEQAFYEEKGFPPPRRCEACREPQRELHAERRDPRHEFYEGEGFPAVCDACGALMRLKFEPDESRPVYCDPCFKYR